MGKRKIHREKPPVQRKPENRGQGRGQGREQNWGQGRRQHPAGGKPAGDEQAGEFSSRLRGSPGLVSVVVRSEAKLAPEEPSDRERVSDDRQAKRSIPRRASSRGSSRRRASSEDGLARRAAWRTLCAWQVGERLIPRHEEALVDARERRFCHRLVRTVVRHHRSLESELSFLSARPRRRVLPALWKLALLGLAQLRHFSDVPPHAALAETMKLAEHPKIKHAKGWLNAVLRRASRESILEPWREDASLSEAARLAARFSYAPEMVERWLDAWGPAITERLCEAGNAVLPVTLACEPLAPAADILAQARGLCERLQAEGVPAHPHPCWPGAVQVGRAGAVLQSAVFSEGWASVQDVSSQLLMHWLAPIWRGPYLDLCAAPGGKLMSWLRLLPQETTILALDRNLERLRLLQANLRRVFPERRSHVRPHARPHVLCADGRQLPLTSGAEAGSAAPRTILIDAPCSSTGVIARHPEIKWLPHGSTRLWHAARQRQLLDEAARVLAPGGQIVYITCSLEKEENGEQVDAFLARHPGFARRSLGTLDAPQGLAEAPTTLVDAAGDFMWLPDATHTALYAAWLQHE